MHLVTETADKPIMNSDALTHPTDTQVMAHALAEAAATAGYAPSVHDTQPWRWRLTARTLELHLVRGLVLPVTDPDGRLATVSCGVALHHARVALDAQGWRATVTRMPDGAAPDLLARLQVEGRSPVDLPSVLHLRTVPSRHTDRRPVSGTPVDPADLAAVTAAVEAQHGRLHTLRPDQILELAAAADHARRTEAVDPAWQAELAYWTGGQPLSAEDDKAAVFVLIYGTTDEPLDWLRAGEALSAGWLTATERGISVLPHSAPVEVVATHQAMRAMIDGTGHPYLVLRLGGTDPADAGLPHASRLPAEQTVDRA